MSHIVKDSHETVLIGCNSELRHDVLIRSPIHDSSIGCLQSRKSHRTILKSLTMPTHIVAVEILEHEDE